jgi:hypothetical protein
MIRTLIAVAVAGAFALPLTSAANDNIVVAQGGAGDTGASSRQEGVNPPGQASPGTPRSATTGIDRQTGMAGATSSRGRFEALDKNHDGYVSRDEAKDAAELNTRFTELDANNDGKLSHDEYSAVNSSARGATGTGSTSGRAGAPMGAGGSSK